MNAVKWVKEECMIYYLMHTISNYCPVFLECSRKVYLKLSLLTVKCFLS